jgi:CrcB protein
VTVLAVALAGAGGATARFAVERALTRRYGHRFPWGTLAVNISGSLALGFLAGVGIYRGLGVGLRDVVGLGFLGGYTTFSTFAVETIRLWEGRNPLSGAVYALGTIFAGVSAAALGIVIAALL